MFITNLPNNTELHSYISDFDGDCKHLLIPLNGNGEYNYEKIIDVSYIANTNTPRLLKSTHDALVSLLDVVLVDPAQVIELIEGD